MRALAKREKRLGAAFAVVAVGAVFYTQLLEPALHRRSLLTQQVFDLRVRLAKMRGDLLLRDRVEQRYARLSSQIRQTVSPDQETARFLVELEKLSAGLALGVTSVKPTPPTVTPTHTRLAVRIDLAGPTMELARFLGAIEQDDSAIRVERLQIVCRKRPGFVNANLTISKALASGAATSGGPPRAGAGGSVSTGGAR